MIKRIITLVILVPVAIALILLSVANRQTVTLAFNPFEPSDPVLSQTAPLFVFLFVALMLGMILGSLATWFNQGKYRNRARTKAQEAVKWHSEADRQKAKANELAKTNTLPASPATLSRS